VLSRWSAIGTIGFLLGLLVYSLVAKAPDVRLDQRIAERSSTDY